MTRRTPRAAFSMQDILGQLDSRAAGFDFPTLDNGYVYPVDARLTAYCDVRRWAITIEHIGYCNRAFQFENAIYGFGNCLLQEPGFTSGIDLVDGEDWRDDTWSVRPGLRTIRIRGRNVRLTPDDVAPPVDPDGTMAPELPIADLFRRLLPRFRALYRATEDELRAVVPADLPQILHLEEWEHSDAVEDVLPSHTECFPMLAQVLVTGDPSHYKPTRPPNTHWSNWPAGGTL
jgi:hypothetical protein